MKRIIFILLIFTFTTSFISCGGKKAQPEPLSSSQYYSEYDYDNIICVPFKKLGGVRTIQVKINDCTEFPMIFDTGCSGMLISIAEVYILAKQGCITANDIEDYDYSMIADGSIVQNMIINLRQIQIGEYVCHNIKASVSNNENAPLLLGNGALTTVKSFSVNDDDQTIKFYLH